jgi:predicted Rossmann fold flavoprotein
MNPNKKKIIIAGGGAAGFFAAIACAENNPNDEVLIFEKSAQVLGKVKVSGGGRCNVTHACFEPKELVKFYPRGAKELLGPFHQFMTADTMEWFEKRGVPLKIEEDNRVFPVSDHSQSIINCLLHSAQKAGVKILYRTGLESFEEKSGKWIATSSNHEKYEADKLMLATGSSNQIWEQLKRLNIKCVEPVSSLFTFNIKDDRIKELSGISVQNATVRIKNTNIETKGALLITHWGLSGPAILKLSSIAARTLADLKYSFEISVNFTSDSAAEEVYDFLEEMRKISSKKTVLLQPQFEIPSRLWKSICIASLINNDQNWADLSNFKLKELSNSITSAVFKVNGKSTFKEEFVTAGGVALEEIDFKRFESKKHPNLFFAGEVLNIDGVTGGFNFQAAWTGGYIAGLAMAY